LGDSYHTFIIAEAGSNWKCGTYKEDLKMAKDLIKTASRAGADAVKFQTYRANTVYVPKAGKSTYLSKSGSKDEINNIFRKHSMPYEMLEELSQYCRQNKILFMSTPFSVDDAREVNKYVKIHKVASYEINHVRLLEFLAKTNKPIILSTGASGFTEIDFAVNLLRKNKVSQLALLQCTAKYPAPLGSLNLKTIQEIKRKYNVPVGLSDHSLDPIIAPLVAIGMGATIIEKHFTMNRNQEGPDHKFALEPNELSSMIKAIRQADATKGTGIKKILKEEFELGRFAVRSVQAIRDISKGETFREGYNIDLLRPGNRKRGADGRFLVNIIGKKSRKNLKSGDGVTLKDCH
jgi:N-acetylneuraminate synthase